MPAAAARDAARRAAANDQAEGKGGTVRSGRLHSAAAERSSLEDRIAGRLDSTRLAGELKPVRLVEGSTVKEFAEKLGIKPKDVVALLLQRGVFATINQASE